MFLKQSVFKRMIKAAYKGGGLVIGAGMYRNEMSEPRTAYIISGGYWVLWVKADGMTNAMKAALIELSGEMPGAGEFWRVMAKEPIQYEMPHLTNYDLPEMWERAQLDFEVTNTIIDRPDDYQPLRLLQAKDDTKHIALLKDIFIDLVDPEETDSENGETMPEGPVAHCAMDNGVMWGNNYGFLYAFLMKPQDVAEGFANNLDNYIKALEQLERIY